jgi:hypothetical protein
MAICGTAFPCLGLTGITPAESPGHAGTRWQSASLSEAGSSLSAGAAPDLLFQGSIAAIAQIVLWKESVAPSLIQQMGNWS